MIARIIKIVSRQYRLMDENGQRYDAILMGKVRRQDAPAAGDLVEAEFTDGRWVVQKIMPRRNRLYRPYVCNVDQALIVMSVRDPDFSAVLVDRLSMLIRHAGIMPVLIVTKCDLDISPETEARIQEYEHSAMPVIRTSMMQADEQVAAVLKGKISVLTGQSGAGKSTLLNTLEPSFRLQTQEISKALGRGKHTTRHNELHEVAGGLVADTPGFSSLDFSRIEEKELDACMLDFEPYLGQCRFNDCVHQNEPGCAVKAAVEQKKIPLVRYQNYLAVLEMIQNRKEKY